MSIPPRSAAVPDDVVEACCTLYLVPFCLGSVSESVHLQFAQHEDFGVYPRQQVGAS